MAVNHILHKVGNCKKITKYPWLEDNVYVEENQPLEVFDNNSDLAKMYNLLYPETDIGDRLHCYISILNQFPEYEKLIAQTDGLPEGWDQKTYLLGVTNSIPCLTNSFTLSEIIFYFIKNVFYSASFTSLLNKDVHDLSSRFYSLSSPFRESDQTIADASQIRNTLGNIERVAIALTVFCTAY